MFHAQSLGPTTKYSPIPPTRRVPSSVRQVALARRGLRQVGVTSSGRMAGRPEMANRRQYRPFVALAIAFERPVSVRCAGRHERCNPVYLKYLLRDIHQQVTDVSSRNIRYPRSFRIWSIACITASRSEGPSPFGNATVTLPFAFRTSTARPALPTLYSRRIGSSFRD